MWVGVIEGDGAKMVHSLAPDADAGLLVAGRFEGEIDFAVGDSTFVAESLGGTDGMVGRYSSEGDRHWGVSFGGEDDVVAWDARSDENAQVYAVGAFAGTADFDPDSGASMDERDAGGAVDAWITKLDPSGGLIWAYTWGGSDEDAVG